MGSRKLAGPKCPSFVLEWTIRIQGPAIPVRRPFVHFPRSNSFQAPFRARRDIECHRVRYLRMINFRNLPEPPARLPVTLRARIERRLMLDNPECEKRINPIFHGLSSHIGLHLLNVRPAARQPERIIRAAGSACEWCPLAFVNGHFQRRGNILRALGRGNRGAGRSIVCNERDKRQEIEDEPKKLLDDGGSHGKRIIHEGEQKANK